ncbi:male sterility protein-domain-containing protein, partial [Favolaschia claudopus]
MKFKGKQTCNFEVVVSLSSKTGILHLRDDRVHGIQALADMFFLSPAANCRAKFAKLWVLQIGRRRHKHRLTLALCIQISHLAYVFWPTFPRRSRSYTVHRRSDSPAPIGSRPQIKVGFVVNFRFFFALAFALHIELADMMDTVVATAAVSPDPLPFFRKQTIFLTGGTGCLGGCILYKLAMKLDTAKIYALVRGSPERGISQLKDIMPNQTDDILATKKVQFLVGDITKKNFGIDPAVLTEMARTVTVVIHSAASISLTSPQQECVRNNCLPVLELATLASSFKKLSKFVFVSTAYVNHHLPDGVVEEKIYPAGDAEKLLSQIMKTGTVSKGLAEYSHPVPYTLVKNLTEQLLVSRNPSLPILIARPTIIAPAISQPYPYYTRHGSCPGSNYVQRYMEAPDSGIFHVSSLHPTGTNIFDEVPVDIAANIVLLHIMQGTTGIIHAGAGSYVRRTLAQLHQDI